MLISATRTEQLGGEYYAHYFSKIEIHCCLISSLLYTFAVGEECNTLFLSLHCAKAKFQALSIGKGSLVPLMQTASYLSLGVPQLQNIESREVELQANQLTNCLHPPFGSSLQDSPR